VPRLRLLAVALGAVLAAALALTPGVAAAHNTLVSSDPADGAVLSVAPSQITWRFDKSVPLETMSVTLIDATGARSELSGSTHGPAGDTEVVTPLALSQPGPVSLRWRLVGPDGHTITGRVDFTVTALAATPLATTPTTAPSAVDQSGLDEGDDAYSTAAFVRWVLRYASYLAVMAVVGVLLTTAYVWEGAGTQPVLRRILSRSLFVIAALSVVQLLVVASDVSGTAPWSSFGSIDAALTTDAGMAFAIRVALALSMWLVLFRADIVHSDVYWTAVSLPGLGLLATWAFAGHSRSMRWPAVGVIVDVSHHAAAAAWIASLAIIGWAFIPTAASDVLVPVLRRFSRVAAVSVATLVGTGLVQSLRLVGSPMDLLDADHGRYLAVKIAVVAVMLLIANANRQRVNRRLDSPATIHLQVSALRRAVVAEFAIGLVIVGITAAMVVSPPSTSLIG
jgi:copper transport protein